MNVKRIINYIFIILILIIMCSFSIVLFREQKNVSKIENRTLNKIPKFTFKSFFNNTFQDNLENSISDQFVFSRTIKKETLQLENYFSNLFVKYNKNTYVSLGQNSYTFGKERYIIEKDVDINQLSINEELMSYYKDSNVKNYFYFIENSRCVNFLKKNNHAYYNKIKEEMEKYDYKGSYLAVDNFDDYMNYYYKTDHHWNYKGSYKGYKQIAKLLKVKGDKIKYEEKITFPINYYGSYAKRCLDTKSKELFTVYTFPEMDYDTYINGEEAVYGGKENYFNKQYNEDTFNNHYASYYGGDKAKIVYDFDNDRRQNLLIFGTSYTNSINDLIASHFNKTYVIDLRHYEEVYHEKFNTKEFIEDNDIDKTIVIGDIYSFLEGEDNNAV